MKTVKNKRFWLVIGPGLVLIGLAFVLPKQASMLGGAAAAWAVVVTAIFRSRERMEYYAAVRHMRWGEFEQAIKVMDTLIDAEPDSLNHRQFRAQLYRLSGDLQRAAADYEWMIGHDLGFVIGSIGLAEIEMQRGDYDRAREYALTAHERDRGWMAAYNLGLIEDRQGSAEAAVKVLEAALKSGIPHRHYRLLARLWLARNYHRLGHDEDASKQIMLLRKEKKGLRQWQVILESEQGAVLRDLLEYDVQLAQQLVESQATIEAFSK